MPILTLSADHYHGRGNPTVGVRPLFTYVDSGPRSKAPEKSGRLPLTLSNDSETWIVDPGASFHALGDTIRLSNYFKGKLDKVYLGDDALCNIGDKGDVKLKLSNETL